MVLLKLLVKENGDLPACCIASRAPTPPPFEFFKSNILEKFSLEQYEGLIERILSGFLISNIKESYTPELKNWFSCLAQCQPRSKQIYWNIFSLHSV